MKKVKKQIKQWIMDQGWSTVEPNQIMIRFPRIDPTTIMDIYNNVLSCQWEKIAYGEEEADNNN